MWFGVAPPSPVSRKDVHPPLCACALHRLERGKRLEAERLHVQQSPRRAASQTHQPSTSGALSSRQRGVHYNEKAVATPRRQTQRPRGGDTTRGKSQPPRKEERQQARPEHGEELYNSNVGTEEQTDGDQLMDGGSATGSANEEEGIEHPRDLGQGAAKTSELFSAKTFAHLGRLDNVGSPVYAAAALSNGRLLCSTKDGRLLLYSNLYRPTARKAPAVLQLATKWISSLQVCDDLVACSSEEVLYVVDTSRMCMVLVFETQHSFITCTRWIHKGALITAGQDNVIKLWTIA
ncbi:hypothetical protein PF011_g8642 [Phytophthora fragariae]|uniref:Uncharacterized protein n=1 Tax=Phytophthora fragariae TaxID=53985 RepID=A0A6A3L0C0_9STRA|nr:hypothetical protein PF011_g8642 [Phytophthora fragariae]